MKNVLTQIKTVSPQLLNFLQVHLVEAGASRTEEQKKALSEFQTAHQKIKWWLSIEALPINLEPTLFISNEYFDALPVSRFSYTDRGWVETCLAIDTEPSNPAHFRYINAPLGTTTGYFIPEDVRKSGEFGSQVEVNIVGMQQVEFIARKLIDSGKGACLIVDYGKDEHMKNTLRGIRGHKFVDPLLSPGDVDLSAWVNYKQLRWALERLEFMRHDIIIHPLITQRDFLAWNGIDVNLTSLVKDLQTKPAMKLLQGYRRLMDPSEMGETYKVFAFQTKNFPAVAPFFLGK